MADEKSTSTTAKDDLDKRVEEAKATDQDALVAGQTEDQKSVGDGGISVDNVKAEEADKPAEATKPAAKSRTRNRAAAKQTEEKVEEESDEDKAARGIDPVTGFPQTGLAATDLSNSTLNAEGDDELEHDRIPDPLEHRDASVDADDSLVSQAIIAEQDPDVETNPQVLAYQIGHFDPESGNGVVSALAFPPAGVVAAEEASQARADLTNGVPGDEDGDGDVDEADEAKRVEDERLAAGVPESGIQS